MAYMAPPLDMPRLRVGDWRPDLAEAAFAIYSDAEVTQPLHFAPHTTLAQQVEQIEQYMARNAAFPRGCGIWPLFTRDHSELVGTIVLKPLPEDDRLEVGWHLRRSEWGKGYASEAGRAAIQYAFDTLGAPAVYAILLPSNSRSRAVAERCGMSYLGRTQQYHNLTLAILRRMHPAAPNVSAMMARDQALLLPEVD